MDALRQNVGTQAAEEETLIASAHTESIAIAIRKGAPLASYSIDRRCMQNYVRDLVKDDTCALICIVCARRFPYVSHNNNMKINKMRLLERVLQGGAESTTFFGLSPLQTEQFVGLLSYVQKFGQMSEDVALGDDHVEFVDWQLRVPFDTATVNI